MAKILTLDAGTSAVKCSLFSENGELLGACAAEYPTYYPREGWAEQREEDILFAAVKAVRELKKRAPVRDADCVGLTGTMNGCIPIDESGKSLYPNMIHLDTRAQAQVDQISREMGLERYYALTGNRPDVHYGLPKMMWLRENEPDVYKKAVSCVNTKDLLYGFLTGIWGQSDYSDASLFGAMNISRRVWDDDVIRAAGADRAKLPMLRPSTDVSGRLSAEKARLLGLREGTPVAVGAGDGPATTHGSGVFDESGAYLTVGSSAWAAALSKTPRFDKSQRAFHYTDIDENLVTVCGTVQCAATALDYMLRDVLNITDGQGHIDFARAEEMCRQSPPGAKGLFFVPTLMGERCPWWDPNARGTLIGLSLSHTRADMVRAAYEGVAQELNLCVQVLRENGIPARRLILSGGGMKSAVFREIFPSVFGAVTQLHLNPREATSLGAAIAAGVGTGIWKSFAEAARAVRTGPDVPPDPQMKALYEKHTPVFSALYGQMKDAMHASAAFTAKEVRS